MSTTPSRFNRTRSSDSEAPSPEKPLAAPERAASAPAATSAPSRVVSHSHTADASELNRLQERLTKVQRERVKWEVELDATRKILQECEAAAQKLGIHSLEDMIAYVEELEKKDAEERERFEAELANEEALLNSISQQLSDLERE